jgi:zinc D-Ala-D-Ala carboxypeptidase
MNQRVHSLYRNVVSKRQNLQFTRSFDVQELSATKEKVDNWPTNTVVVYNMHVLCWFLLQKVRDHFGKPMVISSGYRSEKLNALINGSAKSQHCKGEAADFEIGGIDNRELAKWIHANCAYDQLILEFYRAEDGVNSGWVHCSYRLTGNRKEFLIARKQNGKTKYEPASVLQLNDL